MRLLLLSLAALMLSSTVHAKTCGPTLELEVERGYTNDYDREWERETQFGITLKMPLSDVYCKEVEAKTASERREAYQTKVETMEQMLENFEQLLEICEDHELPICASLPAMSLELNYK